MHARINKNAKRTICGLAVDLDSTEVLAGYQALCAVCFPPALSGTFPVLVLDRDNPQAEDVP
jgi:hypothetical protein